MRRKTRIRVLTGLLVILLFAAGNLFTQAFAEGAEDLNGSMEETIDHLDTEELEKYLNSLTEEQREAFGSDFTTKLKSLLSGDYSLDYAGILSSLSGLFFNQISGLLPVFCVICAVSVLCGILGRFKSSVAQNGTSKMIFFVGYSAVLVLILSTLTEIVRDCGDTVDSLQAQMQAIFPVLLTLIATSGGSVSVAVYQPAVLFLS